MRCAICDREALYEELYDSQWGRVHPACGTQLEMRGHVGDGRKTISIEKLPDGKLKMSHYNLEAEEVFELLRWAQQEVEKRVEQRVSEMLGGVPVRFLTEQALRPVRRRAPSPAPPIEVDAAYEEPDEPTPSAVRQPKDRRDL
jgi:hypothetical protein